MRQLIHNEAQVVFLLLAVGDINVDADDLLTSLMLNHPRPAIDPACILIRSDNAQLKLKLSAGFGFSFICADVVKANAIFGMYAVAKS